jgi:hypothetical protein
MTLQKKISASLTKNINWFINSGVMSPADGSWGVAERILLTKDNDVKEKTLRHFPFYSEFADYVVLEHRRPDCNFQTALLFLLAGDYFEKPEYRETGQNIIAYLYNRSGLLNKANNRYAADTWPVGCWSWTHGSFYSSLYFFDDNAWNLVIPLILAKKYPHLDEKYKLTMWSKKLSEQMAEAFEDQFLKEPSPERHAWSGELDSPHWGSLVCMAMALAYEKFKSERYLRIIATYHDYIVEKKDEFSASEYAYIVIGACFAAKYVDDTTNRFLEIAELFADKLINLTDSAGITPSQWNEAPEGAKLIDLIYTMNWTVLAFQLLNGLTKKQKYRDIYNKQLQIMLEIQDDSPAPSLNGCWRGMYDFQTNSWSGGNRFEGGANSIYTGWTNAPIAIVMLLELSDNNLFSLI